MTTSAPSAPEKAQPNGDSALESAARINAASSAPKKTLFDKMPRRSSAAEQPEQLLAPRHQPDLAPVRVPERHPHEAEGRDDLHRHAALHPVQQELVQRDGGRRPPGQQRDRGRDVRLRRLRGRLHRGVQAPRVQVPPPLLRARRVPDQAQGRHRPSSSRRAASSTSSSRWTWSRRSRPWSATRSAGRARKSGRPSGLRRPRGLGRAEPTDDRAGTHARAAARTPQEPREARRPRVATFHVTPKAHHKAKAERGKQRTAPETDAP
jgi:hypothetical protein